MFIVSVIWCVFILFYLFLFVFLLLFWFCRSCFLSCFCSFCPILVHDVGGDHELLTRVHCFGCYSYRQRMLHHEASRIKMGVGGWVLGPSWDVHDDPNSTLLHHGTCFGLNRGWCQVAMYVTIGNWQQQCCQQCDVSWQSLKTYSLKQLHNNRKDKCCNEHLICYVLSWCFRPKCEVKTPVFVLWANCDATRFQQFVLFNTLAHTRLAHVTRRAEEKRKSGTPL